MDLEEKFLKEFVKVTQQASIATLPKIGKKDKNEVDKLATDAMRKAVSYTHLTLPTTLTV